MSDERRHFARIAVDATVQVDCPSSHYTGRVLDLSLKGALVENAPGINLKTGDRCRLTIRLPESEIDIVMEATAVHCKGSVVGFRCEQIDLDSISHLRRLVELNLGEESQLERELQELVSVTSAG